MADGYLSFIDQINIKYGVNLNLYKESQMKRRLTSLRNKRNFNCFKTYLHALQQDKELLDEFMDRITINVSEFYRNPKRWDVLSEKVLPSLIKENNRLNIWSAACSTGEEPYSVAIMLKERFPNIQANILATDLDQNILEQAKQGIYAPQALKDLPPHKKSKYFIFENNKYYIHDDLKKNITFQKHNLLKDFYPKNIDLLICRNVLIYFTDDAKDSIYKKFSSSLKDNGILFVGSTEQIFNPERYDFSLFDTFYYQKN